MATSEVATHTVLLDGPADPLDAWRALKDSGAILLDGNGLHPEARHAYVALHPRLEVRITKDQVQVIHDDGAREEWTQNPQDALRDLTTQWKFAQNESGFTGGFVGVIGYGFTHAIEPTLPRRHDAKTPDLCLRLCRDVIVFDKANGTVQLHTTDLPGESDAKERAARIQNQLAKPMNPVAPLEPQDLEWRTSMDADAFQQAVVELKERIRDGDLFQANLATRFEAPFHADPAALFAALRDHNPSPYMALMDLGDHVLVSGSPEQLFAVEQGRIRARPIAGTRRRGKDDVEDRRFEQELLTDAKEQAEHTMLVDLLRNDIARVSVPGTVHVPERGSVERYRRVMHLVSRVEGTLRGDADFTDWVSALFPGGTITGAPKHRACMRIHDAEPVARGHYTGSAGYLNWDHSESHWNILIRTMILQDGWVAVHAGSGIVAGSDPEREWMEAGNKAQALLEAATGQANAADAHGDEGSVTPHGAWKPPTPQGQVDARVLLVDHYDSFVHNLADHCAALGANVYVVRSDDDIDAALRDFQPTHVIFGPGPGWPADAGHVPRLAKDLVGRLPVLGVCLGHQALGMAAGANVVVGERPVHGEVDAMHHNGAGVLAGLPRPMPATRYHSLVVTDDSLPAEWEVTARLEDGTVMAMEHRDHPVVGLQFHPESIGTPHGLDILFRFLTTS